MSAPSTTFLQEAITAAQGSWRLLIGRRDAPAYFDVGLQGLVSSFVALFASIGLTLATTALVHPGGDITSFALVITNAVLYATLVAASWAVLRALGKVDKFVPFIAVDNWLNAYISIVMAIVGLFGAGGDVVMFIAVVAGLAARINNARLIAELSVGQIIMLMAAQVVGVLAGMTFLGLFIPVAI